MISNWNLRDIIRTVDVELILDSTPFSWTFRIFEQDLFLRQAVFSMVRGPIYPVCRPAEYITQTHRFRACTNSRIRATTSDSALPKSFFFAFPALVFFICILEKGTIDWNKMKSGFITRYYFSIPRFPYRLTLGMCIRGIRNVAKEVMWLATTSTQKMKARRHRTSWTRGINKYKSKDRDNKNKSKQVYGKWRWSSCVKSNNIWLTIGNKLIISIRMKSFFEPV